MGQAKPDDICDFGENLGEKAYLICDLVNIITSLSQHTSDGGRLAGAGRGAAVGLLPADNRYSFFPASLA